MLFGGGLISLVIGGRRLEAVLLERGNLLSVAKVPRQQIVPRGGILLASLTEKITPTPNKTAKEAKFERREGRDSPHMSLTLSPCVISFQVVERGCQKARAGGFPTFTSDKLKGFSPTISRCVADPSHPRTSYCQRWLCHQRRLTLYQSRRCTVLWQNNAFNTVSKPLPARKPRPAQEAKEVGFLRRLRPATLPDPAADNTTGSYPHRQMCWCYRKTDDTKPQPSSPTVITRGDDKYHGLG
ncbi:hypothetical protein Bbelb_192510 [Branchiostoma belcheri]|nr:hypothetical protein Bbelb_192510 [Branchiostoma belcheri]